MQKEDTYSYKGWMNSDSMMKRSAGVFCYCMAMSITMWLVLSVAGLIMGTG